MVNKYWNVTLVLLMMAAVFYCPLESSILNSVKGTITDQETGEPIPGAAVILTGGPVTYTMTTNSKGSFYKSGLKTGQYQVKYEKEGYIPAVASFRLRISETRDLSVKLKAMQVVKVPKKKNWMRKGVDQLNARKYPDAIETLTKAIEETPENPVIYYYRGFALDKSGDRDKALADYKKSLELDPELILSLGEVGKIYAKKGDLNNAVTYYKKAYELDTRDVLVIYNYGVCLFGLGNNDEALKVYEKLLTIDPNYGDAYYQLGLIYMGLNNNAKAKEYLRKFLELEPESSNAAVAKEILNTL